MAKQFVGLVLCLFVCGCGAKGIGLRPKLDLTQYERVGVVSFALENVKGSIGKLSTQYFIEEISNAQTEIQILTLGDLNTVLDAVNQEALDATTIKAIGEHFKVPAIFVGTVSAANLREIAEIYGGSGGGHIAELKVIFTAKLFSTETGERLWQGSKSWHRTFGIGGTASIGIEDGMPYFVERNAERFYGEFVSKQIRRLIVDFRSTFRVLPL